MAKNEGAVLSLAQAEREYVRKNFLSEQIKSTAYGTLVNSLDPREQIKVFFSYLYNSDLLVLFGRSLHRRKIFAEHIPTAALSRGRTSGISTITNSSLTYSRKN